MNIGLANDHRGLKLKNILKKYLGKKGYDVIDYGSYNEKSQDYPDYAFKLGEGYNKGEIQLGIVICGTGIGMSIACNKIKNIRCAKVNNTNEAKMARKHNDANVIALNEKLHSYEVKDIIDVFLKTKFNNEERLIRRNEKIREYEENGSF